MAHENPVTQAAGRDLELLADLLSSLVDLHRRLLALSERKRALLAAMDLDGLSALMQTEQELYIRIDSLELDQHSLLAQLLVPELLPQRLGRDVLLRRVILVAPEPLHSRLASLRKELLDLLASLRESQSAGLVTSRHSLRRLHDAVSHLQPFPGHPRPDHAVVGRAG